MFLIGPEFYYVESNSVRTAKIMRYGTEVILDNHPAIFKFVQVSISPFQGLYKASVKV